MSKGMLHRRTMMQASGGGETLIATDWTLRYVKGANIRACYVEFALFDFYSYKVYGVNASNVVECYGFRITEFPGATNTFTIMNTQDVVINGVSYAAGDFLVSGLRQQDANWIVNSARYFYPHNLIFDYTKGATIQTCYVNGTYGNETYSFHGANATGTRYTSYDSAIYMTETMASSNYFSIITDRGFAKIDGNYQTGTILTNVRQQATLHFECEIYSDQE